MRRAISRRTIRKSEQTKRIEALERALTDVITSYEDERARIKAGNADKPSVSGQTVINRARALLPAN